MKQFTNPLDTIRVASPCRADWNKMYGSDRKRFCADCKLNVYNLSEMTRQDAENLIMASEGRLCVRFFRRADGTVLTKNCPVGWQAAKRRVSRVATAAFSMITGMFAGIFVFDVFKEEPFESVVGVAVSESFPVMGDVVPYPVYQGGIEAPDEGPIASGPDYEVLGVMVVEPTKAPARRSPRRK